MANQKTFKKLAIHFAMIFSLGAALLFAFFYVYLPVTTKHGESITVPNLESMTYEEAREFLEKRNLRLEIFDSTFVPGLKPMTIISQNPSPMQNVKENRKIYITVTPKYAPKVAFPDVIDVSAEMVEKILRNHGLILGKIKYRPDLAENAVLEAQLNGVKIEKGDSVYKGSTVDIIVGDGRGTDRFLVPKLAGLSLEEAEYTILGSGLKLGIIEYEETEEVELGYVIRSSPSHEDQRIVRVGDVVNLWVSGNKVDVDTLETDDLLEDLDIE